MLGIHTHADDQPLKNASQYLPKLFIDGARKSFRLNSARIPRRWNRIGAERGVGKNLTRFPRLFSRGRRWLAHVVRQSRTCRQQRDFTSWKSFVSVNLEVVLAFGKRQRMPIRGARRQKGRQSHPLRAPRQQKARKENFSSLHPLAFSFLCCCCCVPPVSGRPGRACYMLHGRVCFHKIFRVRHHTRKHTHTAEQSCFGFSSLGPWIKRE
jgi:hypothetical protein